MNKPKRFQGTHRHRARRTPRLARCGDRKSYAKIRGKDFYNRIVRDVGKFIAYQKQVGATTPRVSLWLTGLKETVDQLPEFVRLAGTDGRHGGTFAAPRLRRDRLRQGHG